MALVKSCLAGGGTVDLLKDKYIILTNSTQTSGNMQSSFTGIIGNFGLSAIFSVDDYSSVAITCTSNTGGCRYATVSSDGTITEHTVTTLSSTPTTISLTNIDYILIGVHMDSQGTFAFNFT